MLQVLIPLVLLLVLGYSFHIFVSRNGDRRLGKTKSELPIHRHPLSTTRSRSTWSIEQNGLTWSLVTSGLNSVPGQILDDRSDGIKSGLKVFYDIGSMMGAIGGVGAIGTTVWTLMHVWMAVWEEARSHAAEKSGSGSVKVLKRAMEHIAPSAGAKLDGLQPLVSLAHVC